MIFLIDFNKIMVDNDMEFFSIFIAKKEEINMVFV
jgi:hypothetical protein